MVNDDLRINSLKRLEHIDPQLGKVQGGAPGYMMVYKPFNYGYIYLILPLVINLFN